MSHERAGNTAQDVQAQGAHSALGPGESFLRLRIEKDRVVQAGEEFAARDLRGGDLSSPNQPFFRWRWDGRSLCLQNDRYGFYPLFYYQKDNEFSVSDSILTLLRNGASAEIDWSALSVFLYLGGYVGADTPFKHIRLVPPNARVEDDGNGLRIVGERPKIRPDWNLSRAAAIDGYIGLFSEAVARMPANRTAIVPLSGGRDSRHIFLELCRQRTSRLSALSIECEPFFRTEDVAVARELANAAGKPHTTAQVPWHMVRLERLKNRLTHMATLEHRWLLAGIEQAGGASVYEGVAGDTLSTGWWMSPNRLKLLEQGDLEGLAETYCSRGGYSGYLPDILTPEASTRCTAEAARHRIAEELRDHLDAANPIGSFHFWNRTRRVTALAPCCLWSQTAKVWCPYLDGRLFDFLCSIPGTLLADDQAYHRFHTDVILKAYPEFAHVPFAGKKVETVPARLFSWTAAAQMARQAVQPASGTLLRTSFIWPRIARALIDVRYAPMTFPLLPLYVYLRQLEYCASGRTELI